MWEGMPSLGLSLAPPPPRASYLRQGWAGPPQASSSLEFLSPFVLQMAVCSGQLIFSLAIPQFKKAPSDCSQGLWARSLP